MILFKCFLKPESHTRAVNGWQDELSVVAESDEACLEYLKEQKKQVIRIHQSDIDCRIVHPKQNQNNYQNKKGK